MVVSGRRRLKVQSNWVVSQQFFGFRNYVRLRINPHGHSSAKLLELSGSQLLYQDRAVQALSQVASARHYL